MQQLWPEHVSEIDIQVSSIVGDSYSVKAYATKDGGRSATISQDPLHGPFFTAQSIIDWVSLKKDGHTVGYWHTYQKYSVRSEIALNALMSISGLTFWWVSWCGKNKHYRCCAEISRNRYHAAESTMALAICSVILKTKEFGREQ